MSQTYYTILTKQGAALLANATALGVPLKLTQMGVGDGNGSIPKPIATQTKLVHEVRRAAINTLFVDKQNPNQIIAEQVIPENEGGWFIHEIGLYDDKGNLIAVGNCPATYKPKLVEGSGRTQVIRMVIIVDNVNSVELKIDPSVVLATREYVDNLIATKMEAHEKSTNHPDATTKSKGFVQLSSATNSTAEDQAATPLAVKNTYDLAASANHKIDDLKQCFSYSDEYHQAEVHSRNQINHFVVRDDDLVGLYSSREKDFLWLFSGDRLHKGFIDVSQVLTQQKHDENGFVKLPSGIILQWLTAVTDTNGYLDARLPISFPNRFLSVFITEASAHEWTYESSYSYGYSSQYSSQSTIRVHSRCAAQGGYLRGQSGRFSLLAIGC